MNKNLTYYTQLLSLALPVVLSQIGQISVVLADTIMVGTLGEIPLAAVAFAGNLTVPILTFGGMAMCITPLVGKRFGQQRDHSISFLLRQTTAFSTIVVFVQLFFAILLWLLMPKMGQPDEVVAIARNYMPILIVSLLPAQMFVSRKLFIEGLHNTRLPMIISISGNILNIVLNFVLIRQIGVNGAAFSTLIARIFMWLAIVIVLRRSQISSHYCRGLSAVKSRFMAVKKLLFYGLPIGGQMVIENLAFSLGGIMMGWVGTAELAAHQIVMTFTWLTFMMSSGISSAITIKVSVSRGQGDILAVRKYIRASLVSVALFMATSMMVFFLGRETIPGLIADSQNVIEAATILMIIGGAFQIFDGLQVVAIGALRGMDDMAFPAYVSGIAYTAFCLPVGYLLAFVLDFGASGIWFGYMIGLILVATMLLVRVARNLRKIEAHTIV